MKKILLVVLAAAVVLAAWLYNGELTIWGCLLALLPVMFFNQGIVVAGNMNKAWRKASPDMARGKAGMGTKISVWSYISSTAILPFLWIAAFSIIGILPLATIIVFLTLPVAIGCSRTMYGLLDGATNLLADLSDRTVTLSLMFSFLLSLAFIIGKFI